MHLTDVEHTRLLSAVDVDLKAVRYPCFGLMWRPGPHWRFGLAEREAFSLALDIDVDVHGQILAGPTDAVVVEAGRYFLESINHNLFSPRQVVAGVAWESAGLSFAADLAWLQWSGFAASTAHIDLELDLGEIPFTVPIPDPPQRPHFRDIVVPRVGVEAAVVDAESLGLSLRLGGFYEPTPAPDQPGITNYIDADKVAVGAGFGLRFGGGAPAPEDVFQAPILLDVGGQHIQLLERRYKKSDPADGVGDSVATGHFQGLAVTLGMQL